MDLLNDNNDKDLGMMTLSSIPSLDNDNNDKEGKPAEYIASMDNTAPTAMQQTWSSLPKPLTSLPLVRKQSIHLNRYHHQAQQAQQQAHSHQLYHDACILQQVATRPETPLTSPEPSLSSCASTTTASTTTTTSVDLSTLITAPTKVHIDHMGTDERSKILASLQLAIERAQAYRDELLDKDREDLRGSRTGGTQGQGAYFQQEQQQMEHGYYQDASYLGNNMNEAKHHQRQRQYQNHNNNSQNQDHQQHQHYNDLHNNMHPYFQNHHYHPPLSPGPGTAATCMSAPSYSSHYNPHQHAVPYLHPPQYRHHYPYHSKCYCLNYNTNSNDQLPPVHAQHGPDTLPPTPRTTATPQNGRCGPHLGPTSSPIPCPAIELLLRASAQSTEARAIEEQRNMIRTKWAAILYTVISTLGILFACALDEKSSDRITFVVMYLLGLIVPIYALVDFGITRSQRLRDTAASAAASVAAAMAVTSGGGGGTNSSNNASLAIKNNNSATAASTNTSSSASASTETKNRDEEAFHTGAFIHHI